MGGKGYGAVDRLDYFVAVWVVDRVYPGLDSDCVQQLLLLLPLRLILIVSRAA